MLSVASLLIALIGCAPPKPVVYPPLAEEEAAAHPPAGDAPDASSATEAPASDTAGSTGTPAAGDAPSAPARPAGEDPLPPLSMPPDNVPAQCSSYYEAVDRYSDCPTVPVAVRAKQHDDYESAVRTWATIKWTDKAASSKAAAECARVLAEVQKAAAGCE